MKKSLCLALLLGWLIVAPQVVERAEASASATASNSATNSVTSGTLKLTAVTLATSPNSGTSLALSYTANRAYFYLKNFGTSALIGFSATQTNSSSTLRYCVGQSFRANSSTQCLDNTAAFLVGVGTSLPGNVFSTALPSGSSYAFCSARSSGANTVNVSVTSSNVAPLTTRS